MIPQYIETYQSGLLEKKIQIAEEKMFSCSLCPHNCRVNRFESNDGECKSFALPIISSHGPHHGEEKPISGTRGSGTIFFTNCNLGCVFCQNYDISHFGRGQEISYRKLAEIMLSLQDRGCHNINFVSPTHMIYAILKGLKLAIPEGLHIPLVYNTGTYDSGETINLLEGIIDIYMPDIKYASDDAGKTYSNSQDYWRYCKEAVRLMHEQVGDLQLDEFGMAFRGLLVRHLLLPSDICNSEEVYSFVAEISTNTYINIMDQYRPQYRANEFADLKRRVTLAQFDANVSKARDFGLRRFDN